MNRHTLFALPAAGSVALWAAAGTSGGAAGLAILTLALVLTWPLVMLALLAGIPYAAASLVPRQWRASYRNRTDWRGRKITRQAQRSQDIPARWHRAVLRADRRRCLLGCHTTRPLHVDHAIPWAWGGLTMLPNLFTLCETCNLTKRDYWVDSHGLGHGHTSDVMASRRILTAERHARRNPLRWLRLAWALT